jgi:hypothetical protein
MSVVKHFVPEFVLAFRGTPSSEVSVNVSFDSWFGKVK